MSVFIDSGIWPVHRLERNSSRIKRRKYSFAPEEARPFIGKEAESILKN